MPDYDTMNAGREMDVLVAEKVMGYQITNRGHRVVRPDGHEIIGFRGNDIFGNAPKYSTDMSAAWEVVEKIISLGKYRVLINPEVGECQVDLFGENYMGDLELSCGTDSFSASTAPLAICRCALRVALANQAALKAVTRQEAEDA